MKNLARSSPAAPAIVFPQLPQQTEDLSVYEIERGGRFLPILCQMRLLTRSSLRFFSSLCHEKQRPRGFARRTMPLFGLAAVDETACAVDCVLL
jgi:hypothetical protein